MMNYQPKSGDIIWLDFDPQLANEVKGRRPAVVVWGNKTLQKIKNYAMVCPITNTNNGFPLHIPVNSSNTTGVIMCEQAKTLNIVNRNCEYKDRVDETTLAKVKEYIKMMIDQ